MIPTHPQTIVRKTRVPMVYLGPFGLPLRWQDDVSGDLPRAVNQYLDNRIHGRPITDPNLSFVIDYLVHVICAPCWNESARRAVAEGDETLAADLIQLRLDIAVHETIKTPDQIAAWIRRCVEIGIDPL
jgi:hypothetical protein